MNLYAVYDGKAIIADIIAVSANEAYYKAIDGIGIKWRQGVKIVETFANWCERDF